MSFCILSELNHVERNWEIAAGNAILAIKVVTKAFINNESVISCKKKIHSMGPLGLSFSAQLYLFLALRVARKADFNQCIFSALEAQKIYVEELEDGNQ